MNGRLIRKCRQAANLTTAEAGKLAHVTRKTWEAWEKKDAITGMIVGKLELFFMKLLKAAEAKGMQMVLILNDDGQIVDGVAQDGLYDLIIRRDNVIAVSLAVNRDTGRPYLHNTMFSAKRNQEALNILRTWPKQK